MAERAQPGWIVHPVILFPMGVLLVFLLIKMFSAISDWRLDRTPLTAPQCYRLDDAQGSLGPAITSDSSPQAYAFNRARRQMNQQIHAALLASLLREARSCTFEACDSVQINRRRNSMEQYLRYRAQMTYVLTVDRGDAGLVLARQRFNSHEDQRAILEFRARLQTGEIPNRYLHRASYARMLATRHASEFKPCTGDEKP